MNTPRVLLPSDLLRLHRAGLVPAGPVAVDTETSGLYPDLGARVSTVSVAFEDHPSFVWLATAFPDADGDYPDPDSASPIQAVSDSGIQTWGVESIDQWESAAIMSFAWPFDQGVHGTGKPEDSGQGVLWDDAANLPQGEYECLLEWLTLVGESNGLTMHHAKFDCQMFRVGVRRWPTLPPPPEFIDLVTWDTQNVADLLTSRFVVVYTPEPRPSSSLKPTAAYYWGDAETDEQAVVKAYLAANKLPSGRWDLMPWDVIAKYADQDARLTCRLRLRQELDLHSASGTDKDPWLDGTEPRLTPEQAVARRLATSRMLYRVERRGLPFSVSEARSASALIQERLAQLEQQLPFRPATLAMAKHYFFGEGQKQGIEGLNRRPYATTPSGAPQMDVAIVQKMVADGLPGAEVWRDLQKLQTADSKWYTGWARRAGADDRLRTSVRQNGTVSGRFSVEGIQLQAIPHDYKLDNFTILDGIPSPRDLIGAGVREGFKMWELDLANAELRVAALYADCKRMLELIDQGADLHADAAQELFHVGPDSPRFGEMRQVAKRFNFAAIFGIGWKKLQADIEQQTGIRFSRAETEDLLKRWNGIYPEYRKAIYRTMEVIEARAKRNRGYGWVTLPNGERRWFLPGEDTHKGFNQRVQPSLAQFGIDWWLTVEQELTRRFPEPDPVQGEYGVVLMVHDSIVLLVPDDESGEEAVRFAQQTGLDLWAERFTGVPGGVDATPWAEHS